MPRHETLADQRLYCEIGLAPVHCAECGVQVLVKKNSRKHTSVQWTPAAVAACPQIAAARATNSSSVVLGCDRLKASIDDAVHAGLVVVPDA